MKYNSVYEFKDLLEVIIYIKTLRSTHLGKGGFELSTGDFSITILVDPLESMLSPLKEHLLGDVLLDILGSIFVEPWDNDALELFQVHCLSAFDFCAQSGDKLVNLCFGWSTFSFSLYQRGDVEQ